MEANQDSQYDLTEVLARNRKEPEPKVWPESALLDSAQAARYLNRSVNFVRRVIRYEVPFVQYGARKACYYHKRDLDMWVLRHTHQPVR